MILRNKVLIVIGLVLLLFLTIIYSGSHYFLIQSFLKLEQEQAMRDLSRIDQALDQINYSLYTFSADWAHWNDAYAYIQGKNPTFVRNNLKPTAFINSNINLITYWNKEEQLLIALSIDTDNKKLTGYPAGLARYLQPHSLLINHIDAEKDIRGYIALHRGIMMIAVCAVTDGDKLLPPLGALLTGRYLSSNIIEKINDTTKLNVQLIQPNQLNPTKINDIFNIISNNHSGHYAQPITRKNLVGYTVIRDIYNHPIAMLEMTTPRVIYLTGLDIIYYYLMSFIILGILFSIILMRLVRKLINTNIHLKQEITERKSTENELTIHKEHLVRLTHYDTFTSLPNQDHIKLEALLRKAIVENEFVLHYQPQLTTHDGLIVGAEALIRWESPELGLVNPAEFIPLAEKTGLIIPMSEWALRTACTAARSWQDQGYQPISVAVNLSAKQFHHSDIATLVASILTETKLPPIYLELEITETAVMENIEVAITKLNALRNMGISISIDDFGTGYASISYLKQFPITAIKIDQSFIKGIPHNKNDLVITTSVITLAHSLGIKVIAEGVETAEQLQFLADNNCDMVQGYYLSKPLTEGKLLSQLSIA
jgi:EAL domain-containing protein (putative c-di-GMP-specific phosphodiesterase class I)/sensor domain CHASE-containing protein